MIVLNFKFDLRNVKGNLATVAAVFVLSEFLKGLMAMNTVASVLTLVLLSLLAGLVILMIWGHFEARKAEQREIAKMDNYRKLSIAFSAASALLVGVTTAVVLHRAIRR